MKKQITFSVTILMLAGLLALPAFGQASPRIKVNVPFGFSIDNRDYPAGEYTFSALKENVVVLEATEHSRPALLLADTMGIRSGDRSAQVRFQCYGHQCFLSQVHIPGREGAYQVHRSDTETRVAAKREGKYIALMGSPSTGSRPSR